MFPVTVEINTEHEPAAFCVLSADAKVLLTVLDDGQLETWSTENGGTAGQCLSDMSDMSDMSDVAGSGNEYNFL